MADSSQEYLEHYGVKGMKWGVRRTPEQLGYKTSPRHYGNRKRTKDEMARNDRVKAYENRRMLSDEELQRRIKRLELEKRFRDLSEEDLHRGRKMIKDVLSTATPQALRIMASGALLYGTKAAMTKDFSLKEAADYIAPKPKKK